MTGTLSCWSFRASVRLARFYHAGFSEVNADSDSFVSLAVSDPQRCWFATQIRSLLTPRCTLNAWARSPTPSPLLKAEDLYPLWRCVDLAERHGEMQPEEAMRWKQGIFGLMATRELEPDDLPPSDSR
jgi:hypothetical protein